MGCGASAQNAYARHYYLTCNVTDDLDGETYKDVIPVWSIAITKNQLQLAASTSENVIVLWCTQSRTQLIQLTGHADTIWKVTYSPDDQFLASASSDGTVRIWEVNSGMPIMILPRRHAAWVWSLAWSPDPQDLKLATGGADAKIIIWRIDESIADAKALRDERENPYQDPEQILWLEEQAAESCVPLLYWQAHEKSIRELAFAPSDPQQLVSIGTEGTIAIWDADSGTLDCRLNGHIGNLTCLAVNPVHEEILATGGEDHTVRLWDIRDIEPGSAPSRISKEKPMGYNLPHFTLIGHTAGVSVLRFSRDARLLASGSKDCEVRLWNPDMHGPTLHARFPAHEAWIRDLQWTHSQDLIYTGSSDGHIFAFQVPPKYHCKLDKKAKTKKQKSKGAASTASGTTTTSDTS